MKPDQPKQTLSTQPGVEQPPSISREQASFYQRAKRRRLSPDQYLEGILRRDRTVLAQAITLIESTRPEDEAAALDIVERCLPHCGASLRVGITGVPGVGKSTFVETLGTYLTRDRGETLAVLAVDPSSEISGGSILGDKTRMEKLAADERAFIRPSPSRGTVGGVARRTREAMLLCEAAGYRNIFIETVGVGQSETAVHAMVDFFLLLMLAGAGDELQGLKRGIIEMTDLVAIHKADGDNRKPAERARREYENALHLLLPSASGWTPRVVTCSSLTGDGIAAIWDTVLEHHEFTRGNGYFAQRRQRQLRRWLNESIDQGLRDDFRRDPVVEKHLSEYSQQVEAGRISSLRAAQLLLELYRTHRKG